MKTKHLSTLSSFYNYEESSKKLNHEEVIDLIKANQQKLSKNLGHPVVSYLTHINATNIADKIGINYHDIAEFKNLISNIDENAKEISIVIHSLGGNIEITHKIVELLRSRFKKVNFIVPSAAHSAAAMMCMSGSKIIITPEGSLGPFDVYIPSPVTQNYMPATEMIKVAQEAKRAANPFCVLVPRKLYDKWDGETINTTMIECRVALKRAKEYPSYWLLKYMFGTDSKLNFINFLNLPFFRLFSSRGRRVNKIVSLFIGTGTKLSHNTPIMYNDLKEMGLSVELAQGELLELIRETSLLGEVLFERSNIIKLYASSSLCTYRYLIGEKVS